MLFFNLLNLIKLLQNLRLLSFFLLYFFNLYQLNLFLKNYLKLLLFLGPHFSNYSLILNFNLFSKKKLIIFYLYWIQQAHFNDCLRFRYFLIPILYLASLLKLPSLVPYILHLLIEFPFAFVGLFLLANLHHHLSLLLILIGFFLLMI